MMRRRGVQFTAPSSQLEGALPSQISQYEEQWLEIIHSSLCIVQSVCTVSPGSSFLLHSSHNKTLTPIPPHHSQFRHTNSNINCAISNYICCVFFSEGHLGPHALPLICPLLVLQLNNLKMPLSPTTFKCPCGVIDRLCKPVRC